MLYFKTIMLNLGDKKKKKVSKTHFCSPRVHRLGRQKKKKVQCNVLSSVEKGCSSRNNHIFKGLEHVIRESISENGKESIVARMWDLEEREVKGKQGQMEADDTERVGRSLIKCRFTGHGQRHSREKQS